MDGTKVYLGGRVTGDSKLADDLRLEIAESKKPGGRISSGYGPANSRESLDLEVPYLLDSWLRRGAPFHVEVSDAPEFAVPDIDPGLEPKVRTIY
jgi:hypothetical protein